MQSSSIKPRNVGLYHQRKQQDNIDNIDNIDIGFESFCKKIGVIHYSTKGKYRNINLIWKPIYQEMQVVGVQLNTFDETMSYLLQKINDVQLSKKFGYEYIIRELNNYTRMSMEFASNYKNYFRRLQIYAQTRKCTNMEELKRELNLYLMRYVVVVVYADKNNKNDYRKQDWLIISRYICDFLEEDVEFSETTLLFN